MTRGAIGAPLRVSFSRWPAVGDQAADRLNTHGAQRSPTRSTETTCPRPPAVTTDPAKASDSRWASSSTASARTCTSTWARSCARTAARRSTSNTTWKFGQDGRNQWTYTTSGNAIADGDDWKISWNPATVAPGLDAGPLSYSTLTPDPAARVLDRTGAELLTQHVVTLVNVSPGADLNVVCRTVESTVTRDHRGVAAGRPRRGERSTGNSDHSAPRRPGADRGAAVCHAERHAGSADCGCWPPIRP